MNIVPPMLTSSVRSRSLMVNRAMQLVAAIGLLCFAAGCGSSSSHPSAKVFTNASLNGNYTYTLDGNSNLSGSTGAYQEAGTFVADGNGHITGGMDDFAQNSVLSSGQVTGSYDIAKDGTGMMALNLPRGKIQLAITLISSSSFYIIEFDSFANGAGVVVSQSTTAFSAAPSGTFIFHFHSSRPNSGALGSVSSVGSMTVQNGSISGKEDVVRAGEPGSSRISGSITAPDASGRGTATITDDAGTQSTYLYYVIDSSTMKFLETDPGPLGGGRADAQSGAPFSNASLNKGFAFSSAGDTVDHLFGVNSAGAFTSDGNGNIVSGTYDSVQDGTPVSNVPLTGTYAVDANGRATLTLRPKGLSPIPVIAWLVDSSTAFFLVSTPDLAEDGRMNQQQSGAFSAASLNGKYAFYMFGYDSGTPPLIDRVGVITFDGSVNLTFTNYFVNRGGAKAQKGPVSGHYVVSPNGRVLASSVGTVDWQVLYLISSDSGSLVLAGNGSELAGSMAQQVP